MKSRNQILLVLFIVTLSPFSRGQEGTGKTSCPDAHGWTGRYRNYSYGFSVVIPADLKGLEFGSTP